VFLQGIPHQIVGVGIPSGEAFGTPTITAGINIQELIDARIAAKQAKNYAESDRIRKELLDAGIVLEDSPVGTTWRRD
jgi:cysteinyl-tRNA synthetase